jgi:lysyl-tRNA synthetase class 2
MVEDAAMTTPSPWRERDRHADRRGFLLARSRIQSALRHWFEDQGFVEVDTSCLQVSPGNETHLHAFRTEFRTEGGTATPFYLHTSPEFACKKLLAAGETRLFTFAHAFRNGERSTLHHPEFVMLEWYRAREPYETLMNDCAAILDIAATAAGTDLLTYRNLPADASQPPQRITVAQAFSKWAHVDLMATFEGDKPDRDRMAEQCRGTGIRVADDDTWSDLFSRVLVDRIEPWLGQGRATILTEYPISEAALARPTSHDARVAERFELYACGVELANAFGELTDAGEQRRRFEAEMAEKQRIYGERYPIDEDFLAALAHMPPASGAALGFDRLVMVATGASRIEDVMWAPVAEA